MVRMNFVFLYESQLFSFIFSHYQEDASAATGITANNMLPFDEENKDDVFHVSIYAQDIFEYYKRREVMFSILSFLTSYF